MSGFLTSSSPRRLIPYSSRTLARGTMKSKINVVNVAWLCVIAAVLLNLLGIMAIGTVPRPDSPDFALKHFQFMIMGILAAGLIALPHYRFLQRLTYLFMILVLGMLVFVLIKSVPDSIVHPPQCRSTRRLSEPRDSATRKPKDPPYPRPADFRPLPASATRNGCEIRPTRLATPEPARGKRSHYVR